MINANELRIGNWVKSIVLYDSHFLKFKRFDEDLKIAFFYKEYIGAYIEHIDPIPLTPEILEKCGFGFGINLQSFVRGRHQFVEIKNMIDGYLSEDGVFYYGVRTKIKHLHQLQNLYFALTGEELNYKP